MGTNFAQNSSEINWFVLSRMRPTMLALKHGLEHAKAHFQLFIMKLQYTILQLEQSRQKKSKCLQNDTVMLLYVVNISLIKWEENETKS